MATEKANVKYIACDGTDDISFGRLSYGDGAEEIAALLPALSAVAVVTSDPESAREYCRALRQKSISARPIVCSDREEDAAGTVLGDEVRMIVALGGEREATFAKRLGKLYSLPVYAAVTSPLAFGITDGCCPLYRGNRMTLFAGATPVGVSLCKSKVAACGNELPAAFGAIVSSALTVFDYQAYAFATGNAVNRAATEKAYGLIYAALDEASTRNRNDKETAFVLADISLKLSSVLLSGGIGAHGAADGCARTAEMLFEHEGRKPLMHGESEFIFGSVLCKLYREFVSAPSVFLPPPDNNLRAERLSEYFGFDEATAATSAVSRVKNVGLAAYRLHEYRDEIADALTDAQKAFEEGKRLFKRLYADDGYGLRGRIEPSDVKTVIALSPDAYHSGGNALLLMRELGYLDRYL